MEQLDFKTLHQNDMCRYNGKAGRYMKQFSYFLRKCQTTSNKFLLLYYRFRFSLLKNKRGLEIYPLMDIGPGIYMGHVYNITINPKTIIGKNLNIHKGVTIGQENRGKRKGTPIIGNDVWIGVNSTIVGKITIGDDVLIAPNSYVNCDIPSHSVVFGNPCIIKHRDNATEGYVNNRI